MSDFTCYEIRYETENGGVGKFMIVRSKRTTLANMAERAAEWLDRPVLSIRELPHGVLVMND